MAEDISITADDWASSIEDSGSSADSVSFGDEQISINDGGSSSGSSSSSSSTSDRYGTSTNSDGSYNVPSGTVAAANQGDQMQSDQLQQIEDATEGNIDKQAVTLGGDGKADDALTVETDQNEVVTATPTGSGTNQPVSEGGTPWGSIPKKAILGALLVLIAVFGGGR